MELFYSTIIQLKTVLRGYLLFAKRNVWKVPTYCCQFVSAEVNLFRGRRGQISYIEYKVMLDVRIIMHVQWWKQR